MKHAAARTLTWEFVEYGRCHIGPVTVVQMGGGSTPRPLRQNHARLISITDGWGSRAKTEQPTSTMQVDRRRGNRQATWQEPSGAEGDTLVG